MVYRIVFSNITFIGLVSFQQQRESYIYLIKQVFLRLDNFELFDF